MKNYGQKNRVTEYIIRVNLIDQTTTKLCETNITQILLIKKQNLYKNMNLVVNHILLQFYIHQAEFL